MTVDSPGNHLEDPAGARRPQGFVQWFILVFWAIVAAAWAWWWAAMASFAFVPGEYWWVVMLLVGCAPAAGIVWKYPTGRLFRAIVGGAAFSLPAYVVLWHAVTL